MSIDVFFAAICGMRAQLLPREYAASDDDYVRNYGYLEAALDWRLDCIVSRQGTR